MKVFTTTEFVGMWVGTAAVIVAEDKDAAFEELKDALKSRDFLKDNLDLTADCLTEVDLTVPSCDILQDGDY